MMALTSIETVYIEHRDHIIISRKRPSIFPGFAVASKWQYTEADIVGPGETK